MMRFRYFPSFPQEARFDTRPCHYCGQLPALDGVWLDFDEDYDDPPPVCVDDLLRDVARVSIPKWIQNELAQRVANYHAHWDARRVAAYVAERTNELAHTPPVPWIQENEWPLCDDDYATFVGQLTRDKLEERFNILTEAKLALRAIFAEERPGWQLSVETLDEWWERLGNHLRIYVFRCETGKEMHVLQTM